MKKSIVAVFVILALVVIISPGIVGKLAEKSVDEQLQWAAVENRDVVISSESFARGWFSSEGRHRIEFGNTGTAADLKKQLGFADGEAAPAIIIETRLDHGLIPVTSMSQSGGSLTPGLGRAISTISIESADGRITQLPGVVHSHVGLGGALSSNYSLEPGSTEVASWSAANLDVEADARKGHVVVDGDIESLSFMGPDKNSVTLGGFELASDMAMTDFGYAVGDLALSIDTMNIKSDGNDIKLGPFTIDGTSGLDDERLDVSADMDFAMSDSPVGDIGWSLDFTVSGVDAAAAGRLQAALDQAKGMQDPGALYAHTEKDLMDLVAGGFEMRFDQLDVTLPQGTLTSTFAFSMPPTERQDFAWTGVLLDLEAQAGISIPAALYEFASAMNPQVSMAVGMGFLKKNGDNYEMAAEYRKGLLTVNGAPLPIPLPGM